MAELPVVPAALLVKLVSLRLTRVDLDTLTGFVVRQWRTERGRGTAERHKCSEPGCTPSDLIGRQARKFVHSSTVDELDVGLRILLDSVQDPLGDWSKP